MSRVAVIAGDGIGQEVIPAGIDIVKKAARVLEPHGYLILGSTESLLNIDANLQRVAFEKMSCYQLKNA